MFPIQVMQIGNAAGSSGGGGGGGGALVSLPTPVTATRNTISPTNATATYQLAASGTGLRTQSGGGTTTWAWLLSGLNSDYQVRATLVSGTSPSGSSLSSWLSLGTDRSWSLTEVGVGNDTCTLTVEIRKVVDNSIIATATVTINVGVN